MHCWDNTQHWTVLVQATPIFWFLGFSWRTRQLCTFAFSEHVAGTVEAVVTRPPVSQHVR